MIHLVSMGIAYAIVLTPIAALLAIVIKYVPTKTLLLVLALGPTLSVAYFAFRFIQRQLSEPRRTTP